MITTEKRAQLYLPFPLYQEVLRSARSKGISFAQIVREALQNYLKKDRQQAIIWENDPLNQAIGFFKGPKDLSRNIDKTVYENTRGNVRSK